MSNMDNSLFSVLLSTTASKASLLSAVIDRALLSSSIGKQPGNSRGSLPLSCLNVELTLRSPSPQTEPGGGAARGQRQELRRLPDRRQEVQQQPLLLVLPCSGGKPAHCAGSHLEGGEGDTSRGRDLRVNSTWLTLALACTFVPRSCVFFILQLHEWAHLHGVWPAARQAA